jgi:hypothetical protein
MPDADFTSLVRFIPIFTDANFSFGKWKGGEAVNGEIQSPYYLFSPEAESFVNAAYSGYWVRPDINWSGQEERARYIYLCSMLEAIETAGATDIAHILTTLIRGDRFNEGMLAEAFENGLLRRILIRVGELASSSRAFRE